MIQVLRELLRHQLVAEGARAATMPEALNPAASAEEQNHLNPVPWSAGLESLHTFLAQRDSRDGQMLQPVEGPPRFMESQEKASQQWQASMRGPVRESPRATLDLSWQMADGEVRGGDPRMSSMPEHTLDYNGLIRASSQQLRPDSLVGGMPRGACMERAASCSAALPAQTSAMDNLMFDPQAPRRVSADKAQCPNLELGAGLRNSRYHQVYNQAYEISRAQAAQYHGQMPPAAPAPMGDPRQSAFAGFQGGRY